VLQSPLLNVSSLFLLFLRRPRGIVKSCGSGYLGDLGFGRGGDVICWFGWGMSGGAFEQFAFVEDRACADEGDQVRCVDGAPAGLRGVDEDVALRLAHFGALPQLVSATDYLSTIPNAASMRFCGLADIAVFTLPFDVPAGEVSLRAYRRALPDSGIEWMRSAIRNMVAAWVSRNTTEPQNAPDRTGWRLAGQVLAEPGHAELRRALGDCFDVSVRRRGSSWAVAIPELGEHVCVRR
jgi:hypothetical protein